jgi:ADP-ribosylglycohydrolase
MSIDRDKFLGMLVGHNIGDALGAPHEFWKDLDYDGTLKHEIKMNTRYQGVRVSPVGSTTDDTGMTLALLESIIRRERTYDVQDVCLSYMVWSNAHTMGQGKNTRALFQHP